MRRASTVPQLLYIESVLTLGRQIQIFYILKPLRFDVKEIWRTKLSRMRSHRFLHAAAWVFTIPLPPSLGFLLPRTRDSANDFIGISQQQSVLSPDIGYSSACCNFTVREQNDSICNAGVKQWTGLVDVSNEKKLFFCKSSGL